MTNVTVEIPEDVLALAGLPDGFASRRATHLLALELFREGRAALGRAAELAGVGVKELMEFSESPHFFRFHCEETKAFCLSKETGEHWQISGNKSPHLNQYFIM